MITKENLLSTEEIRKGIKGVLTLEEAQTRVDYGLGVVTMIDPVGRVFYFTDHRYMSTNVIGRRFCALLAKFPTLDDRERFIGSFGVIRKGDIDTIKGFSEVGLVGHTQLNSLDELADYLNKPV